MASKTTRSLPAAVLVTGLLATGLAAAPAQPAEAAIPTVSISPDPSYQGPAFQGWGTSLVWFANATGGYPEEVRRDLFDKVFGEEGLNLNVARYNIGGGNATDVPPYLRPGGAVEGWWNPDLGISDNQGEVTSSYADRDRYAAVWDAENPEHYDFTADETQRWWIDALKAERDDMVWEAFSNSPPYFLTESGYVSGGINNATSEQLVGAENIDAFVTYLTTVVEHIEAEHGIDFATLDPFNEPNTNYWQTRIGSNGWPTSASRQEGAHIGPAIQDQVIKALAAELAEPDTTTDVAISAMDETNPGIFATNWNAWSQEAKDLVEQLNVHTYGTGDRTVVRDIAKAAEKPLWMSEVEGDWDGTGFNLTNIENGLGVATRMIDDMRELEPSAWVFWQPVEDLYNMEKVENLNWGSVFIDFDCNAEGDSLRRIADGEADPSCEVLTNAKYNTVRNFTHYIRPGDRFIPSGDTQTAAALGAEGGVTLVHVNSATTERSLEIDLSAFGEIAPGATVTPIVTTQSPADDVTANALVEGQPVAVDAATASAVLTVPAKSVTTLLIEGVGGVAEDAAPIEDGERYQVVGVQSGKALTAAPATGTAPGATITTLGTDAATAGPQTWTIERLTSGVSHDERVVLTDGAGRVLGTSGGQTRMVEATVEQAAADRSLQWILTTTEGRTYSLVSAGDARALEVGGQSTAENAPTGTWPSNSGANQRWTFRSVELTGVEPVAIQTIAGVQPALPSTVTPRYAHGTGSAVPVEWDTSGIDWQTPGSYSAQGTATDVFGTPFTATLTVEIGGFASTDPVSVTTYAGAPLDSVIAAAPDTVPAQIGASTNRFETTVVWDWSAVEQDDLATPGTIAVTGSARSNDPAGEDLPALLTIIVTEPDEANVAPRSTPSATFTESSSYSVTRTINGNPTDKGWSNWRSGTKNAQDTLTYRLAEPSVVEHVTLHFYKDGSSATWADRLRVEYQDANGAWVAVPEVDVQVPLTGPAPVVDVELGGVTTSAVRAVLIAHPQTHLIVSEVEIWAKAAGSSSVSALGRLTIDGQDVEGFDPADLAYEYEATGADWPVIGAAPLDTDADVVIVQPEEGEGTATITVTAVDGSTTVYTVEVRRAPTLVTAAATARCVAGKVALVLQVANVHDGKVSLTLTTPFGTKKATAATGKTVSHAFTSRLGAIEDGIATVSASADIGGQPVTTTVEVPYAGIACR